MRGEVGASSGRGGEGLTRVCLREEYGHAHEEPCVGERGVGFEGCEDACEDICCVEEVVLELDGQGQGVYC